MSESGRVGVFGPEERFELVVESAGILPIPDRLRASLQLEPGDLISLERWPGSVYLEVFNAFLEEVAEAGPFEEQWPRVASFLRRPLACATGAGVPIPETLFLLQPGARVVLQVLRRRRSPELYLYPADLLAVRRELALELNA